MRQLIQVLVVSLLVVAVITLGAHPGWAQAKSELTIALSSFSAETLDPALQGHNVKYYLSLMFDYLVGTTPEGQPSPGRRARLQVGELGGSQALDVPSPQGRQVPHGRRHDRRRT